MNLYDLTKESESLQELIEEYAAANDGDITAISATIDEWAKEYDVEKKLESICYLVAEYEAKAEAQKDAADKMADKATANSAKAARLKEWALYCLESSGKSKADAGVFSVSVRTAPQASLVLNAEVPDEYMEIVKKPNNAKIKACIQAGENLSFAHLAEKKKYIQIR